MISSRGKSVQLGAIRARVCILPLEALLLPVALCGVLSGCSRTIPVVDERAAAVSPALRSVIEKAVASSELDELPSKLKVVARVRLRRPAPSEPVSVARLASDGRRLLVVDMANGRVDVFSSAGEWLHRLGRSGTVAGALGTPTGVVSLPTGGAAVLDFNPARLSLFDAAGDFDKSLLYSRHSFSGTGMVYWAPDSAFYVFGARASRTTGAVTLVHKISLSGELLGTCLQRQETPGADVYYEPYGAIGRTQLVVGVPYSNQVYRITGACSVAPAFVAFAERFQPPKDSFHVERLRGASPERIEQEFGAWRLTWTPVDGLAVVGDTLLVALQTFDPLRYRIEMWSLAGRRLGSFSTNSRLLTTDSDGLVYFLASANPGASDEIIVARVI